MLIHKLQTIGVLGALLYLLFSPLLFADEEEWINIGPYGGGVIRALAFDTYDSNIIYTASAGPTVFKSTDGGNSWQKKLPGFSVRYISTCLAVDPQNTNIVYLGFYENYFGESKICKSQDGGNSWVVPDDYCLPSPINSLAVNPSNTDTLYTATDGNGVYRSHDGGSNWEQINNGLTDFNLRTLVIDPISTNILYVAGVEGAVFKSTNSGNSWVSASTGLVGTQIHSLVIDTFEPTIIYAATSGDGIFKSTDSGDNWNPINTGLGTSYIRFLAIDPNNTEIIYAGGLDNRIYKSSNAGSSWELPNPEFWHWIYALEINPGNGSVYVGTSSEGIYRSVNGGIDWQATNNGLNNVHIMSMVARGDSGLVYVGSGGSGMFKSADFGNNWVTINVGLPPTFCIITTIAIAPSNHNVIYIGEMGCGVSKSTNGGDSWNSTGLCTGMIFSVVIDPYDEDIVYAGLASGVWVSTDGGDNWVLSNGGVINEQVQALAIDPNNSNIIYAGTLTAGMFKSLDSGQNWQAINNGLPALPDWIDIRSIIIDPTNTSTIYLGTYLWDIFKSTDAGFSWVESNSGLYPYDGYGVTAIIIDPAKTQTLYCATGHGLYKSDDGADSWIRYEVFELGTYFASLATNQGGTTVYAGSQCNSVYSYTYTGTGIEDNNLSVPIVYFIFQNYPNPFNPTTKISYQLKEPGKVVLNIYNVRGQLVKKLVYDEHVSGKHSVVWDGKNENGKAASSGIYLYRMQSKSFSETRKMIFLK